MNRSRAVYQKLHQCYCTLHWRFNCLTKWKLFAIITYDDWIFFFFKSDFKLTKAFNFTNNDYPALLVSSILDFVTNEIQSPIDKWQDLSNTIIEAIFRDSKEEESNGVSPMSNDKRMTLLTKSSLDWKFRVLSSASSSQQGMYLWYTDVGSLIGIFVCWYFIV